MGGPTREQGYWGGYGSIGLQNMRTLSTELRQVGLADLRAASERREERQTQ